MGYMNRLDKAEKPFAMLEMNRYRQGKCRFAFIIPIETLVIRATCKMYLFYTGVNKMLAKLLVTAILPHPHAAHLCSSFKRNQTLHSVDKPSMRSKWGKCYISIIWQGQWQIRIYKINKNIDILDKYKIEVPTSLKCTCIYVCMYSCNNIGLTWFWKTFITLFIFFKHTQDDFCGRFYVRLRNEIQWLKMQ